jgi:hypothetical protein
VLSGDNMAAYFELPFQELTPGAATRVRNSRPIGDAVSGLTLTLDARARLGDAATIKTSGAMTVSGQMPIRANARYIAPRLDCSAGAVWTFNQGIDFEIAAGNRR